MADQLALQPKTGGLFGGGAGQGAQGGGGLFGGGGAATTPGLFGQAQKPNSQAITSLFHQQAAQPTAQPGAGGGGGLFGAQTQVQQASIQGGLFGGAPKPAAAAGGGLFGGGAPAQPAAGGGLFGGAPAAQMGLGQTQQAPGGGGLFGGAGAAPAQSTGLFGGGANPPANPAAAGGGLFGGGQPANAGGGLFGQKPATPGATLFANPGAAPGGFANPSAQPGGFNMPTGGLSSFPQAAQNTLLQAPQNPMNPMNPLAQNQPKQWQIQQMVQNFQSPEFIAERKKLKHQKQLDEIKTLFDNFQQNIGLKADTEINQFTNTFYNSYAEFHPKEDIEWRKNNVPKYFQVKVTENVKVQQPMPQGGMGMFGGAQQQPQQPAVTQKQEVTKNVHINLYKWLESHQQNISKDKYYTVQLNSTQDLVNRAEGIIGKVADEKGNDIENKEDRGTVIAKLEERLKNAMSRMKTRQQEQNETMMNGLEITKVKNQQILSQLIRVHGKFENLVKAEGRAQVTNCTDQNSLQNAQNKLLDKINDPSRERRGLMVQVEDIQTTVRQAEAIDEEVYSNVRNIAEADKGEEEITDNDLQDMFNVLKKQKRGIDILTESINESTRQLMVMEREIELGSGHRRLAARRE